MTNDCVFSWFRLTVYCFFPDVVDSHFPEQVDTFLESLTPFLKRLSFSWSCWQLWKTLRWFAKRLEAQSLQRVFSNIPPAKLRINLQILFILAILFILPHLFLHTSLFMDGIRSLHTDAVDSWFAAVGKNPLIRFFHLWYRWLEFVVERLLRGFCVSLWRRSKFITYTRNDYCQCN